MPDSGLMLELCSILDVSVNELFSGERMNNMEIYKEKAEEHLFALNTEREQHAENLLRLRCVISFIGIFAFCVQLLASVYVTSLTWSIILLASAIIELIVSIGCAGIISQKAGFYECGYCNEKYVPNLAAIIFAPHKGRTKYLKCPSCGKCTWNKKRLIK